MQVNVHWISCICWLHLVYIPVNDAFALVKWPASCFHSVMGYKHLRLQCDIHSPSQEATSGTILCLMEGFVHIINNRNFFV